MRSITCVAAAVAILTSGTAFAQDVILPQAGEDITDWVRSSAAARRRCSSS